MVQRCMNTAFKQPFSANGSITSFDTVDQCGTIEVDDGDDNGNGNGDPTDPPDDGISTTVVAGVLLVLLLLLLFVMGD